MTAAVQSSGKARSAKSRAWVKAIDVKSELRNLSGSSKTWISTDSQARGLLYNLLGILYELNQRISKSNAAKISLRQECTRCRQIRQSKMWKIADRSVLDLLIAYAVGTDASKAATRSQWKAALTQGKKQKVQFTREAFSSWLHAKGGIEGVLTAGKQRSPNRAVKFDFVHYASTVDPSVLRPVALDLAQTPSYSEESFNNNFALVLVTKAVDPDTGKSTGCAVVDIVNDPTMVAKAAAIISQQAPKKH
jgi:hypothetical protein